MAPNNKKLLVDGISTQDQPIAIIGMGCRFSGIATNPQSLWTMLTRGISSWSNNGGNRFKLDSFWHPNADVSGCFNCQGLHLMKQDPALFDNDFFGLSGTESKAMDPQQRMMLEVAYEAFENAGITIDQLEGSQTGVYCAVSNMDYEQILGRDPEMSPSYRFTGTGPSIVSNRISYTFNLHGPSMTIDTACSSSLVALHEACKTIRSGEASMALVGGTNLILDPEKLAVVSSMHFLSSQGRCYPFDAQANGYGRGEGIAAVLLKPLEAALKDGDNVRCVILGSSVNSDGRTPGITMPSVEAQTQVIRNAYEQAGVDPKETVYIEAHGTGTKAGDLTEATAFAKTFCPQGSNRQPLLVGTVKANLGHTESTAGLAGLIKTILILEKGVIPPNPNFKKRSEELALIASNMQIPEKTLQWPKNMVRRASVHTTGYGGTNAHVILESAHSLHSNEAERVSPVRTDSSNIPRPRLFLLTHQRSDGLIKSAQYLKRSLSEPWAKEDECSMRKLASTLATRRTHFSHRASVVASDLAALSEGLERLITGVQRSEIAVIRPLICFAFTGQGAQWARMGCELLTLYPVFTESMQNAEKNLLSFGAQWHLIEELNKPEQESLIDLAWLSQPCCTAIQVALVDLLDSWGIRPQTVCGHSSGEIAAAYAAGALSAHDALKVAYFRGEAVRSLKKSHPRLSGAMLSAGLSISDAQEYMMHFKDEVVVACINSPASVTLSGNKDALREVQRNLELKGIFNRMLNVDVAYHSDHMKLVESTYLTSLGDIQPRLIKDGISFNSSVTGHKLTGFELNASYWVGNLVSPVRFSEALMKTSSLHAASSTRESATNSTTFVEIGPHSALQGPISQVLKASGASNAVSYRSTMKRHKDASQTVLSLAGDLFTRGLNLRFEGINIPEVEQSSDLLPNLPPYNWHHERLHWSESRRSLAYRLRRFPKHDLLGTSAADSTGTEPTWRNYLRLGEIPWLRGHCIQGQIILPAAAFISMATEALKQQYLIENHGWKKLIVRLRQVVFTRPLLIPDTPVGVETLLTLRPYSYSAQESSKTWNEFRITSFSLTGETTEHCRGLITAAKALSEPITEINTPAAVRTESKTMRECGSRGWTRLEPRKLYHDLKALGANYSGFTAQLDDIFTAADRSRCGFEIPDVRSTMPFEHQRPYVIHPLTLEACFQSAFVALKSSDNLRAAQMLSAIENLEIDTDAPSRPGLRLKAETETARFSVSKSTADIVLHHADGSNTQPLVRARGVQFTPLETSAQPEDLEMHRKASAWHKLEWGIDPSCSSAQAIARHCEVELGGLKRSMRCDYDRFSAAIIQTTLRDLSSEDESRRSGDRLQLLKWMRLQKHLEVPEINEPFVENVRALGAMGEFLVRLSPNLSGILQGDVDLETVLGKSDLLDRLYDEDDVLDLCYARLAKYCQLLLFKNPKLRVLEFGGRGVFPLADAIFDSKHKDSVRAREYLVVDSPVHLGRSSSSSRGRSRECITVKELDINKSPESQGFEPGSLDLIIVPHVECLTDDPSGAFYNFRSLLAPGGWIAILELTKLSLHRQLVSGCLPDWWHKSSDDRYSPLLNTQQWQNLLEKNSLAGNLLEMKDHDSVEGREAVLIISQAGPLRKAASLDTPIHIISPRADDSLSRHFCDLILSRQDVRSATHATLMDTRSSKDTFIFLLEQSQPFLVSASEGDWQKIKDILSEARNVIWVTRGGAVECAEPLNALITGLSRSLRSENPKMTVTTLDIDPQVSHNQSIANDIYKVVQATIGGRAAQSPSQDWEYALRDGAFLIPRLVPNSKVSEYTHDSVSKYHPQRLLGIDRGRALGLRIRSPGLIDSLYWADSPGHTEHPRDKEIRVEMKYLSINFRDVLTALGELETSSFLIEGSGIVTEVGKGISKFSPGDAVYVFDPNGLATTSNVDVLKAVRVRKGLDMRTAAASPVAYATVLYGFQYVANLQAGETILIHSAAGAVGQAAITIAQWLNVGDIFVTVGTSEKGSMLQERFGIPAENIFSSRDTTFGQGIRSRTNGRGVDVVLNSLTADAIRESCALLAPFGRFVEIGKKDLQTNGRLELKDLAKCISFSTVDLVLLAEVKPAIVHELFETVFDLIDRRQVKAIEPIAVKPIYEIESMFRLMQSGKHIGKLLVEVANDQPLNVQPARPRLAKLRQDGSYLVVGGTGGLGVAVVRYLAQRGAKRIITLSRSGGSGKQIVELAEELRSQDVELVVVRGNVAISEDLQQVQTLSQKLPLRGVIHSGVALQDIPVSQMTAEQWHAGLQAKVNGTINLQAIFGGSLDFLILLSSVSGVLGTYSQGTYCAGNTFLDAFARSQISSQTVVRSIDLGIVVGEGIASHDDAVAFATRQGIRPMTLEELTAVIDSAIQNQDREAHRPSAEKQIIHDVLVTETTPPHFHLDPSPHSHHEPPPTKTALDAKYSHIFSTTTPTTENRSDALDIQSALMSASTPATATHLILSALLTKITHLLALSETPDLQQHRSLASYGLDSLTAVELRNWIAAVLGGRVEMVEMMGSGSMVGLAEGIARKSRFVRRGIFPDVDDDGDSRSNFI